MRAKMLERWLGLLKRLGAKGNHQEMYHLLAYYYMQPHRHYHTLEHISRGLHELDQVRALVLWPNELELAWWFHDAIYETWAEDNEARSANLANFFIAKLMGLERIMGVHVHHLILPTNHGYKPREMTEDQKFIVDIDLAELGKPEQFDINSVNLRTECYWKNDKEYNTKTSGFLEGLLKRPNIYLTPYFREKYESQARENLEREIARLRA